MCSFGKLTGLDCFNVRSQNQPQFDTLSSLSVLQTLVVGRGNMMNLPPLTTTVTTFNANYFSVMMNGGMASLTDLLDLVKLSIRSMDSVSELKLALLSQRLAKVSLASSSCSESTNEFNSMLLVAMTDWIGRSADRLLTSVR